MRIAVILAAAACPVAAIAQCGERTETVEVNDDPKRIGVVTDAGLRRTVDLRDRSLREARIAMLDCQELEIDVLRALAARGDGLAAFYWVKRTRNADPRPDPREIAEVAVVAVAQGRATVMRDLANALGRLPVGSLSNSEIGLYARTLYPQAWAGNPIALAAVVDLNGDGRLFGALSERTRARILEAAEGGDGSIELRMAMRILSAPEPSEAQLALARGYLERASSAEGASLGLRATAQNLITVIETGPASISTPDGVAG